MCDLNQLLSFVLDNPKELFGTQKEGTPSLLVVFILLVRGLKLARGEA